MCYLCPAHKLDGHQWDILEALQNQEQPTDFSNIQWRDQRTISMDPWNQGPNHWKPQWSNKTVQQSWESIYSKSWNKCSYCQRKWNHCLWRYLAGNKAWVWNTSATVWCFHGDEEVEHDKIWYHTLSIFYKQRFISNGN